METTASRLGVYSCAVLAICVAAPACSGDDLDEVADISSRVVYGDDDRQEYYQVTNGTLRTLADATAVLMTASKSDWCGVSSCVVNDSLRGLCAGEEYAQQEDADLANCSAWLVAPDLVITAGHCITSAQCADVSFAFGWKVSSGTQGPASIPANDVYQCEEVVAREYGTDDYALVRLDRSTSRVPYFIDRSGSPGVGDDLVVAGYPYGLPLKVDRGGEVKNTASAVFFTANLDTFGGNSGSVVFREDTRIAQGILVRGETDFVFDTGSSCWRINTCADTTGCPGFEEVQRVTRMPLDEIPLHSALVSIVL